MSAPKGLTAIRDKRRRQWLLAHPDECAWLLSKAGETVAFWRKHPTARGMCTMLKTSGLYSRKTIDVDICCVMRRAAINLHNNPIT